MSWNKLPIWTKEAVYGAIFGFIMSGTAFLALSRESVPAQMPVLLPTIFLSWPGIFLSDRLFNGSAWTGIATVTLLYSILAGALAYKYRMKKKV